MTKSQKVLELAGYAGSILLKSGAEIFRVQETMGYIIEACGITNYNIFVVSNGIFATIGEGTEEHYNLVRYVPLNDSNFTRIHAVNSVSRQLREGLYDVDTAMEELKSIETLSPQPKWIQIIGCGLGGMSFGYVFGGGLFDCIVIFLINMVQRAYALSPTKVKSKFTVVILRSGLVTFLSAIFALAFPRLDFDILVIGSIFALFPGVLFTNSIREFFNGDYLSGIIHIIHAILVGVCVALGVCSVILLFRIGGIVF